MKGDEQGTSELEANYATSRRTPTETTLVDAVVVSRVASFMPPLTVQRNPTNIIVSLVVFARKISITNANGPNVQTDADANINLVNNNPVTNTQVLMKPLWFSR
ncbi:hypothetical protein CBL_08892 [Carabus blaptoides fortunei]